MSDTRASPTRTPGTTLSPAVLPPHDWWSRGAWYFRDDMLQRIEVLLGEAFRLPAPGFASA